MCHSIFVFNLIVVLNVSGKLPTIGWEAIVLLLLGYVPIFTLIPRFIVSTRVMYARNAHGARGDGIDTDFGLVSSGRDAGGRAIVFMDIGQNEGCEDVEEIPMELGTI